jgi:prolyl oligopeptidase
LKTLLSSILVTALTLSAMPAANAQSSGAIAETSDPFLWLEEVEGDRALAWARAENARTLPVLQGDPRYQGLYADALKIVTARDRVPLVAFSGATDSRLRNFWQDDSHVRGLWRRTSLESYRSASPDWETVLDLDALAREDGANWVWKGADCLSPDDRYCLLSLSDGGKDAVTLREFDTVEKRFVEGGFVSPEAKQNVDWLDRDTLLIATDWGPGSLTRSSYPRILKQWKRGTPLSQARELFAGEEGDISVYPVVLRDADGKVRQVMFGRATTFYDTEYYLFRDGSTQRLPLPTKASLKGLVQDRLVFTLEEDWTERSLKQGDLIAFDLKALQRDPKTAQAEVILRPGPREAIEDIGITRNNLVVALYENVKGAAYAYRPSAKGWTRTRLDLPANASISLGSGAQGSDRILATVAGYLTPTSFWLADGTDGKAELLKSAPSRFDAANHLVEQFEAVSRDGTKVPYFVVRPKTLAHDGQAPTLLYGYGGFQVSMLPSYSGTMGKLWLERGGVYVVANIRGGGEFGPGWHEQGLKENRQRVYDDFFAVSEDLIARKITSPRRLGIMGGSNGGLLMGVALTQRPELYNAVVVQVPLFDMQRYTVMGGAGASWAGEYGEPTDPDQWAYISRYSPYQNLKAGQPYPEVFIETSTKDDRVHPGHARKAAARLQALGYPVLYYENIDGGHAASANLNETARRVALEYSYLSRRLMD